MWHWQLGSSLSRLGHRSLRCKFRFICRSILATSLFRSWSSTCRRLNATSQHRAHIPSQTASCSTVFSVIARTQVGCSAAIAQAQHGPQKNRKQSTHLRTPQLRQPEHILQSKYPAIISVTKRGKSHLRATAGAGTLIPATNVVRHHCTNTLNCHPLRKCHACKYDKCHRRRNVRT